ncbi:hypothetical protein B0E54_00899 [Micromonospora sp. MH99]|nr:hypothetical protein [Micromonospora sp. MH99]
MARPPAGWRATLWTLVTLAGAFAALSLLRAAIDADVIKSPGAGALTALSIVVPLALFFAFLAWSNRTKSAVEAHGGTLAAVRNWAVAGGSLLLFLSYLLPMKTPVAFHLVRALAALLVIVGAWILHRRVERLLAEPAAPPAAVRPDGPQGAGERGHLPQQRGVSTTGMPLSPEPQPEDWNAALWDPEVQRDIEARQRRSSPPA